MAEQTTHFGFQEVPWSEKQGRVKAVFDRVAGKYDLMNDLMSFGIHRVWKRFTLDQAQFKPGEVVLDLAGGTGDLALKITDLVGDRGQVVLADINQSMLSEGRVRLDDAGKTQVEVACVDAQHLPFPEDTFDCVTMAFGLRNVTDKDAALASIYRVLKPGGRLLVLEFSKPVMPGLAPVYDAYSFHVLPKLGEWVLRDRDSYQYLAESIRKHPDQNTFKEMMVAAGFSGCRYWNLTGGIVALHVGRKGTG